MSKSARPSPTLSMSSSVRLSTSSNATLGQSKSATLCLRECVSLPSLAMVVEDLVELGTPMDNHKHPPAGMFQSKSVNQYRDSSARMFQSKSAGVFPGNSAGMFQDNNATLFQDKSQDKSVGTPLPSSATMHPWKSVPMFPDKSQDRNARPSQWNSVTLFQESNVRASLKKCARLQQKKDVLTPQDKSAGTLKVKHVEIIRERFLAKNAKL